jgi:hypothetical protein
MRLQEPWRGDLQFAATVSSCWAQTERFALPNLLTETIETSRYPLSPRMQTLRAILAKLGPAASTEP